MANTDLVQWQILARTWSNCISQRKPTARNFHPAYCVLPLSLATAQFVLAKRRVIVKYRPSFPLKEKVCDAFEQQ
jgi:hypothetical protein